MIEKINVLLKETKNKQIKALCESSISTMDSALYQNVPDNAKVEIEKAVVENLFNKLKAIDDKEAKRWLGNAKRVWAVKNLGVREAVNYLDKTEAKDNIALKHILENYKQLLEVEPEVLIYENFITAMQSFNYFPKVGNAIDDIKDRVNTYESDVSITKIIETMKKTQSSYLVPLIEDLVQNYLDNKTSQTKNLLKEGLIKFSYDPFVRDIINLVAADVASLQLEYANGLCDIEKIYSPILYLGENEVAFTIKDSYYIKRGNNLNRLNSKSINKLDRNFVQLCEAINSPNVVINGKTVAIYENKDKAVIYSDHIVINEQQISSEEFENAADVAGWTGKTKLMHLVRLFNENFNEIAEIDFAKRVYLKENQNYAADVFKLRGNIFIATYNPTEGNGTFYRNINPIQAKNLMMEHLRFDVSKAFQDLLPDADKINEEIIETKQAYREYIQTLNDKISVFKNSTFKSSINNEVVNVLKEELNEIQNEYKEYMHIVESFEKPISEAAISLEVDGPLKIEVNGQKYIIPIPQKDGQSNGMDLGTETSLQQGGENLETPEYNQFGTKVGDENIDKQSASSVTFNDGESELLSQDPSIEYDEVDLGADYVEADLDAEEAEKEIDSADGDEGEGAGDDEGEIKIDSEEDISKDDELDLDLGDDKSEKGGLDLGLEDEEEKGEEEPEEEKTEKVEDSTSNRTTPSKKKVYLKKKKK